MYAVVETGSKQYRAQPGEFIEVEKLAAEVGQQVTLNRVLLIADQEAVTVGQPTVAGATVIATVMRQAKHRKVLNFRYAQKKRQRVRRGHRQPFTQLRIEAIQVGAGEEK